MEWDALIIGGGFYGCTIALYLADVYKFDRVLVVEKESDILKRASFVNQARVHTGYHYPRDFTTAFRSRANMPKFVADWQDAIKKDFRKLYAIARSGSYISSKQFAAFCEKIGAELAAPPSHIKSLFNDRLIDDVFQVTEYAFDAAIIREIIREKMHRVGVALQCQAPVEGVSIDGDGTFVVTISSEDASPTSQYSSKRVFNCAYSGISQVRSMPSSRRVARKHEITEMALIALPGSLEGLSVTVMDGPFFSVMPFPSSGLHSLSHVRYTPHFAWVDREDVDPYSLLEEYRNRSNFGKMIRDAARFVPALRDARHIESLFEIKTVLMSNENNDGRPILFQQHVQAPGYFEIMGGKIDNIYDVLDRIDKCFMECLSIPKSGRSVSNIGAFCGN
ncbi:FAD-dependent oxidoreductase [Thiohalobacter sp.]|uniref:FAD-dependent oxidoreductase n=1 Tax=Thiohalobacter sp. TaxID=2025948 RepID=UPI0026138F64|nr:FAD-dependent oxidoreductase [Thiohalobacter sp.]